jgi:voltage-gated potassium channel
MPATEATVIEKKNHDPMDLFQFVILILSGYVVIVFALQTFIPNLSPDTTRILNWIDFIVCTFFLGDFLIRFSRAPSKLEFMKWGWVDLVSSIPVLMIPVSGHMRLLRIVRLFRILRAFRSTKILAHYLFLHRARTGVISVILITFLIGIFAAVAELNLETTSDANIKTSEDALWWAFSTMTTVGCEKYPVTDGGRVIAFVLMCSGVCLFGCITAYIATVFLEPMRRHEDSKFSEVMAEMKLLREKIDALESSNQQLLSRNESDVLKFPSS